MKPVSKKSTRKISTTKKTGSVPQESVSSDLVDMQQAIDLLKTTRPTFYRWLRSGKIKGMKIGRQWRFYREDIERFLKGQAPRIDLPGDIGPLADILRQRVKKAGSKGLLQHSDDELQNVLNLLIVLGVTTRASDIHIGPVITEISAETSGSIRLRIDGVLNEIAPIDVRLLPGVIDGFRSMANCDLHEKEKPQDGRIVTRLSELTGAEQDKLIDIRACFLPTGLGESMTLRILDPSAVLLDLDRIEYSPNDMARLRHALSMPSGIVVISGPAGSGKTTVLYSCLNELTGPGVKTMSVEDPIEYILPWMSQVAVNEASGMTYAQAIVAILRSDPDVIMVGEIKDKDTLAISFTAALSGHMVLTTMHVREAAVALKRMVDLYGDPFSVAEAVKLVLTQLLVRKLCPECSREYKPTKEHLKWMEENASKGGLKWEELPSNFRQAVCCDKCSQTGYRRRNVIAEVLEVTPEIGEALRNNASAEEIKEIAVRQGMTTLAADGIRRVANGETTIEEIMRVLGG